MLTSFAQTLDKVDDLFGRGDYGGDGSDGAHDFSHGVWPPVSGNGMNGQADLLYCHFPKG